MGEPERLSEEEARRLWLRAAELQAEAAERLEAVKGEEGGDSDPEDGYALEHVRAAAVEAGIGREFVELALAEVAAGREPAHGSSGADRLARRFLGEHRERIVVTSILDAPPVRVHDSLLRVFPASPLFLHLVDAEGRPADGARLVFGVPGLGLGSGERWFAYEMAWCDVKELHVQVAPASAGGGDTRVTLVGPLEYSRRLNLWVGGAGVGAAGVAGAVATIAVVVAVSGALGVGAGVLGVVAALAGLMGGGGTVAAGTAGWRALYRYALARGERAFRRLVQQVDLDLRTRGELASGAPPARELPGGPPPGG